jgi:hypothetical protein
MRHNVIAVIVGFTASTFSILGLTAFGCSNGSSDIDTTSMNAGSDAGEDSSNTDGGPCGVPNPNLVDPTGAAGLDTGNVGSPNVPFGNGLTFNALFAPFNFGYGPGVFNIDDAFLDTYSNGDVVIFAGGVLHLLKPTGNSTTEYLDAQGGTVTVQVAGLGRLVNFVGSSTVMLLNPLSGSLPALGAPFGLASPTGQWNLSNGGYVISQEDQATEDEQYFTNTCRYPVTPATANCELTITQNGSLVEEDSWTGGTLSLTDVPGSIVNTVSFQGGLPYQLRPPTGSPVPIDTIAWTTCGTVSYPASDT